MYVLVTYDVSTTSPQGKKRLRHVARICLDYGQRVQNSVFEMKVAPAQWTDCRKKLEAAIESSEDSLRYYYLGTNWHRRVEHVGAKPSYDVEGPLII